MLLGADVKGFTERRSSPAVGRPEHRVIWSGRVGIAAKIGEIDQTGWLQLLFLDPSEYRTKVRAPSTFRFELDGVSRFKILTGLNGRIAVHDVNDFRLRVIGDRRNLSRKLGQLFIAD